MAPAAPAPAPTPPPNAPASATSKLPKVPDSIALRTLWEKLIKIGAKVTRHSKCVLFQLAEVAVTRNLFAAILDRIARLAILPPQVP